MTTLLASWSTKGVKSSSTDVFGGAQRASFSPRRPGTFASVGSIVPLQRRAQLKNSPIRLPGSLLWQSFGKIFSFCSVEEQLRTRSKKIGSPCTVRRGHVISSPNNASAPEGSALFVMTANHSELQKTLTMQDSLSQSPSS